MCNSPPNPLTSDLCSSLVGRAVVCMSPLPVQQLVFESCKQGGYVYVTPFLFGILCLSFVGMALVCMSPPPPSLTGDLCSSRVSRSVVCMSPLPPSLTGHLCLSLVGWAVVCSHPPPLTGELLECCRQGDCV